MKIKMLEIARRLSYKSSSRFKLGCVIVNKNRVISMGWNDMQKTHTKSPHPWHCIHAEIHALLGVDYRETRGCDAYVYRETRTALPVNAKPCPTCRIALKEAGIRNVYYTHEAGTQVLKLK